MGAENTTTVSTPVMEIEIKIQSTPAALHQGKWHYCNGTWTFTPANTAQVDQSPPAGETALYV